MTHIKVTPSPKAAPTSTVDATSSAALSEETKYASWILGVLAVLCSTQIPTDRAVSGAVFTAFFAGGWAALYAVRRFAHAMTPPQADATG